MLKFLIFFSITLLLNSQDTNEFREIELDTRNQEIPRQALELMHNTLKMAYQQYSDGKGYITYESYQKILIEYFQWESIEFDKRKMELQQINQMIDIVSHFIKRQVRDQTLSPKIQFERIIKDVIQQIIMEYLKDDVNQNGIIKQGVQFELNEHEQKIFKGEFDQDL